jgi:hypothetical protein
VVSLPRSCWSPSRGFSSSKLLKPLVWFLFIQVVETPRAVSLHPSCWSPSRGFSVSDGSKHNALILDVCCWGEPKNHTLLIRNKILLL